ncbi:MAG: GTP-binding protein [Candidatus Omnitrophica bacterium]|nr:GTP-binding protein [Candidatus Omnitrophota bacterium]
METLKIVMVGHVDHGKSTLVGRLLHETGFIPESKLKHVQKVCEDQGKGFEFAFLLDALEEERDQGITIDVSQMFFKTRKRNVVIIDAPGHKEFLKNMVSGASNADVAFLLIDAEEGIQEQTQRHAYLLSLLGIGQIAVVVNKMDLVDYSEEVFNKTREVYGKYLESIQVKPAAFIPISATRGENVMTRSRKMPWYAGPSILEILDGFSTRDDRSKAPFRFPVQDVYKFDKRRILAGRVESGAAAVGDEVLFLPSGKSTKIRTVEKWNPPQSVGGQASPAPKRAAAGESVGFTMEEQVFVERGDIGCLFSDRPLVSDRFQANLFWMGTKHLQKGGRYILKIATQEIECVVESILKVIDSSTLEEISRNAHEVAKNEVAELILTTKKPIAFDTFDRIPETGRFVIVSDHDVRGGGIILKKVEHFSAI